MTNLTPKERALIDYMLQEPAQIDYGYSLIIKKSDAAKWFDELCMKNFFEPEKFESTNTFLYLEKIAEELSKNFSKNKITLENILLILNNVSRYVFSKKENNVQNVCTKYFSVLVTLPIEIFKEKDFEGIKKILTNEEYRLFIPDIQEFFYKLTSHHSCATTAGVKAILGSFTQYKAWYFSNERFTSKIDIYSLIKLFNPTIINNLGTHHGKVCSEVLAERLKEISQSKDMEYSRLWRRAIEDHEQNRYLDKFLKFLVDNFRDVLLKWVETDAGGKETNKYILTLLKSDCEILKRIAIFVINEKFNHLKGLVPTAIKSASFNRGCFHETYYLLTNHFNDFSKVEKGSAIRAINSLTMEENEDIKVRFFYTIKEHSDEAKEFLARQKVSNLEHPDFLIYTTSGWLIDKTPYTVDALITFVKEENLFEKLNEFQTNSFEGVTIGGLCNALEMAVSKESLLFSALDFTETKHSYQYAYIKGLQKAWMQSTVSDEQDKWKEILKRLFQFLASLLTEDFWQEKYEDESILAPLTPNINWIPDVISDFLMSITRSDEKAAPKEFLPDIFIIIQNLISHLPSKMIGNENDAMQVVINTAKGRAIDALIYYALHIKRLSVKGDCSEYPQKWEEVRRLLDEELGKCKDGNFEFSTLLGAYIENINYIDASWLKKKLSNVFPTQYKGNFYCAVQGLGYASVVTEASYKLLKEQSVTKRALSLETISKTTKEHLLQHTALAYLEGWDDKAFEFLFEENKVDELALIVDYFSLREEQSKQKKDRVLKFFEKTIKWLNSISEEKANTLLKVLPSLIYYLDTDPEQHFSRRLLPFVKFHIDNPHFRRCLAQLANKHHNFSLQLLAAVPKTNMPTYDYDGYILSIMKKCSETMSADKDFRDVMDRLRELDGIQSLHNKI